MNHPEGGKKILGHIQPRSQDHLRRLNVKHIGCCQVNQVRRLKMLRRLTIHERKPETPDLQVKPRRRLVTSSLELKPLRLNAQQRLTMLGIELPGQVCRLKMLRRLKKPVRPKPRRRLTFPLPQLKPLTSALRLT